MGTKVFGWARVAGRAMQPGKENFFATVMNAEDAVRRQMVVDEIGAIELDADWTFFDQSVKPALQLAKDNQEGPDSAVIQKVLDTCPCCDNDDPPYLLTATGKQKAISTLVEVILKNQHLSETQLQQALSQAGNSLSTLVDHAKRGCSSQP